MSAAVAPLVIADSRAVLAKHARSFRWAAAFLPQDAADDAAVVYAFCRLVDDTADEAVSHETALSGLDALEGELVGQQAPRALVRGFLDLAARRKLALEASRELIRGVRSDLLSVRIQDEGELIRYAYQVAGTVGLMMCPILGVTEGMPQAHAIDLGIAMQITNICRDVAEDAGRGRIYVPATLLRAEGIDPEGLIQGEVDRVALSRVIRGMLATADRYYASGQAGLGFIPARARLAIAVAARIYGAIGHKLLREGADPLRGRTVVGAPEKALRTAQGLGDLVYSSFTTGSPHDAGLHLALGDLPGAHRSRP